MEKGKERFTNNKYAPVAASQWTYSEDCSGLIVTVWDGAWLGVVCERNVRRMAHRDERLIAFSICFLRVAAVI